MLILTASTSSFSPPILCLGVLARASFTGYFIWASRADVMLLRSSFAGMVARSREERILGLVGRFNSVLCSSDIAVDDRHTTKLYSRFLAGLLAHHTSPRQEKKGGPHHSSRSIARLQMHQCCRCPTYRCGGDTQPATCLLSANLPVSPSQSTSLRVCPRLA